MIMLSQEICQEMGLTYWQVNTSHVKPQLTIADICREEKELLRKILMVKGIELDEKCLMNRGNGVVEIMVNNQRLLFEDVQVTDSKTTIYLSKLADMIISPEQKKLTWQKLKNRDFNK